MKIFKKILATVLILSIVILSTCSKPPEVTKNPNATKTVILVGGLGQTQLSKMADQIKQSCPQCIVVESSTWNGYQDNVVDLANSNKTSVLILVGHSFGGSKVINAASKLDKVDYLVAIDPVNQDQSPVIPPLSDSIQSYDWYVRSSLPGIVPVSAKIANAFCIIIKGGHNDLPNDQQVINETITKINSL